MLHMSLEGSPGCGKTKLAKIISKILTGLGILENDNIVYAKRTDLIGKFLGETGYKTQNIINNTSNNNKTNEIRRRHDRPPRRTPHRLRLATEQHHSDE